jgi:hypothetical protein
MDAVRTYLAVAMLIAVAPAVRTAAATRSWTGTGSNRLWSTHANWSGALVPSSGDDLVFPGEHASFPSNNDLEPDALYTSMSFTGHFDLTGHSVSLGAGGLQVNHPGQVFLNVPFKLAAPQTWTVSPSGDVYISGAVDLGSNAMDFVLGPFSSISFSRPISGTADITLRGGDRSTSRGGERAHLGHRNAEDS